MPSFVGCIAELHVVNRRVPRLLIQDQSTAEASLSVLLWPVSALPPTHTRHHFLLLPFLSQDGVIFTRLREVPQNKIKFIF